MATKPKKLVPRGNAPRQVAFCKEDGHPFWPGRVDQAYCSNTCRAKHHKRRYERGAALYDFAMNWRGKRLKGGFTELCQMLDEWLRDEKDRLKDHKKVRDKYKKENGK